MKYRNKPVVSVVKNFRNGMSLEGQKIIRLESIFIRGNTNGY